MERPALTCAYAMQPVVIKGLAKNVVFRGRGLLARFLYAAPQKLGRQSRNRPRAGLRRHPGSLSPSGAGDGRSGRTRSFCNCRPTLRLCSVDWEAEIETMLAEGGQMEIIRDWGAKLAGATLRLAAVLHCVEHGPAGHIEGPTIAAAVEIARYLVPHAEAVLNMMLASEETAEDDARYVLRWIERHGRREFTKRDAQQHGKRRFPKADDIDPALAELTRRGFIRPKPAETSGPGRPPSPAYEVNPAAFGEAKPEKRSHNSHNSPGEPENGDSGNIESALEQTENANRVRVTI